jgi:hypothetical protein
VAGEWRRPRRLARTSPCRAGERVDTSSRPFWVARARCRSVPGAGTARMVSWVCPQTSWQAARAAGLARPGTAQPVACARRGLPPDRDFDYGRRRSGRWRGTSSIALANPASLGQSQITAIANCRSHGRPRLPKGLCSRAQVRRSNLHSMVPGCEQGPCSALVQHGCMRQSGESGGASGSGAGLIKTAEASLTLEAHMSELRRGNERGHHCGSEARRTLIEQHDSLRSRQVLR